METLLICSVLCLCLYGIRHVWTRAKRMYRLRKLWILIIVLYDDLVRTSEGYPDHWPGSDQGLSLQDITESTVTNNEFINILIPTSMSSPQKHYLQNAYERIDIARLMPFILRHEYMSSEVGKTRRIADEASRKYNQIMNRERWANISGSRYYRRCMEHMEIANKKLEELNANEYLR